MDSNVSTRSPNRVPVRTWAVVVRAERHCAVHRERHQRRRCHAAPIRLPCRPSIPEIVTSLPAARPPASSNNAWYRIVVRPSTDQPLGRKPNQHDQDHQYDTDESRPNKLAYRGTSASGLGTPPALLPEPGEHRCSALEVGHPPLQLADVVVEETAVRPDTDQLPVVLGGLLQRGVQPIFSSVEGDRQSVELVYRPRQRRARIGQ